MKISPVHIRRSLKNLSNTIRSCAPAAPLVHRWHGVGGPAACQSVRCSAMLARGGDEIFMRAE